MTIGGLGKAFERLVLIQPTIGLNQLENVKMAQSVSGRSAVAVVAGVLVKSVSVLIAWYVLTYFVSTVFNSLVYSLFILGVGAFVAGLAIGFVLKQRYRSAYMGFVCAVIPTLVFSFVVGQGSWSPLGAWLLVFLFAPLDGLAAAGGVLGASVSLRVLGVVALIVLVLVSLVAVQAVLVAPTVHYGDLIVDGNRTMTIENREYQQHGNVTVTDSATLIVRNGILSLIQSDKALKITVDHTATLVLENSELPSVQPSRATSFTPQISVNDNATMLVNLSMLLGNRITASQTANVTFLDSFCNGEVDALNQAHVSATNSYIRKVASYSAAHALFANSTATSYYPYDSSTLEISDRMLPAPFEAGYGGYGSISPSQVSTVTVRRSVIDGLFATAYEGTVIFNNATLRIRFSVDSSSAFNVAGNVSISGIIDEFAGVLVRDYVVITNPHALLNISDNATGVLLLTSQADANGQASFSVTFTQTNYLHTLVINDQKPFNMTSTTPIIYG